MEELTQDIEALPVKQQINLHFALREKHMTIWAAAMVQPGSSWQGTRSSAGRFSMKNMSRWENSTAFGRSSTHELIA